MKSILQKSLINQKLVVALPWVVQFISMLDSVSLRSEYYREVFQLLYELYIMTTDFENHPKLSMRPTSLFIVRSCLGWLFDQPNVPNEYYTYRQNRKPLALLPKQLAITETELQSAQILVPKTFASFFQGNHQIILIADNRSDNDNSITCTLQKFPGNQNKLPNQVSITENKPELSSAFALPLSKFDPLLENTLISACPFLADFRVSIMPKHNAKTVSRTGRYRHITTKLYENIPNKTISGRPEDDAQNKLIEAFLHSQSLSVRRTVEFVQERVFSAVVKDFQVEIFIPFKRTIVEQVDKIQLSERQAILDELYKIYMDGEKILLKKWHEFIKQAALERVKVI